MTGEENVTQVVIIVNCLSPSILSADFAELGKQPYTAQLSKQHNNTNILAFGARVIGIGTAKMIVDSCLNAVFEGGRHQERINMITEIENENGWID